VGVDPAGVLYFGNSIIVTPVADVVARATTHEGWISARLDPAAFQQMSPGSSQPQLFDHLADRNVELYRRYAELLTAPAHTAFAHPTFSPRRDDRNA
jgi:predicted amidohydrolase